MKKILGVILLSLTTTGVIAAQTTTKIDASKSYQMHEWQLTAKDDSRYFMLGPDLKHSKVEVHLNERLEDGNVPDSVRLTCTDTVVDIHPGETGKCELSFSGAIAMSILEFKNGSAGTYIFKE